MMNKDPIIYFHRDGKPGFRFSLNPEKKRKLTQQLRDENIRIAEERGREDLAENFKGSIEINLTPSEIREKLKGGKHGKKENR
jgi:hypothetical protein